MSHKLNNCIRSRGLRKCAVDQIKIENEINESYQDLISATTSFEQSDFKWAIIKAYYSMFHGGKSLVFSVGYREKSHECVIVAVEEFFTSTGKLPPTTVQKMNDAKSAREAADYGLTYGDDAARLIIQDAGDVYHLISEYLGKQGITVIPLRSN